MIRTATSTDKIIRYEFCWHRGMLGRSHVQYIPILSMKIICISAIITNPKSLAEFISSKTSSPDHDTGTGRGTGGARKAEPESIQTQPSTLDLRTRVAPGITRRGSLAGTALRDIGVSSAPGWSDDGRPGRTCP
ncbi:MAG TPA: hypothetical protein VHU42_15920, partial [Rhodopila sp.]|nr:hypothetical protein [Rhodopila sp.]